MAFIVSFPIIIIVGATMLAGSAAFAAFNPAAYGTKVVVGALWVLTWVIVFFPADRICARHLAGDEPTESQWLIVKFTVSAIAVFLLAVWVVTVPERP